MVAWRAQVSIIVWIATGTAALAACGDRSGPGYRAASGKCVGWAELGRVCGSPPTTNCTPENVAGGADQAASHRDKIEQLRQLQTPPVRPSPGPNPQK